MIFRALVGFEIRHQLSSPLFMVSFAIFFLLSFGATTLDEIQIGSLGNVWKNSPFAIAQTVAVLNLFAMFVTTAFAANAVVRDDETGFSPILRSTRIRKTSYLAGRFVGAGIVSALVCLAVPIGILVGSLMPWQDPEKIGPLVPGHYVHAVLVFGLPTQVVLAAFFFAVATATRSMMWTYVGVVAFLVGGFLSVVRTLYHRALNATAAWVFGWLLWGAIGLVLAIVAAFGGPGSPEFAPGTDGAALLIALGSLLAAVVGGLAADRRYSTKRLRRRY
jgi:hypothetical protein